MRNIRRDGNDLIKKAAKEKKISEDEEKALARRDSEADRRRDQAHGRNEQEKRSRNHASLKDWPSRPKSKPLRCSGFSDGDRFHSEVVILTTSGRKNLRDFSILGYIRNFCALCEGMAPGNLRSSSQRTWFSPYMQLSKVSDSRPKSGASTAYSNKSNLETM